MIRRTQLNINYSNKNKLSTLDSIFNESKRLINLYIDKLWEKQNFSSKFIDFKIDTWLSARMQQCLGKQALEIVKSQRKKNKKTKPVFNKSSLNLDQRFIDLQFGNNTFDVWIKLSSIGKKIKLKLPSRKHKHFNKFKDIWSLRKSCRLRQNDKGYFVDLYFEKPELQKTNGGTIGLDCGYKKLLISSENNIYDVGLEQVYEKTSRKKQGSKAFKRSLTERDNKINQSINLIDFNNLKTIVVENLKNVKHKTKGKIRKKFNNKLQRWSYAKVLSRLSMICEELGILLVKVDPAYTSQTCSNCGFKHKSNRKGEKFLCLDCNIELDADFNAARNILHRGAYSPCTT